MKATETDSLSSSEFVYNGPRQDSTTVCAKVAASCDDWSPYRIGGHAAGCPLLRFRLLINPPRLSPHRDAVRRLFAAAENEPRLQTNQMIFQQMLQYRHRCALLKHYCHFPDSFCVRMISTICCLTVAGPLVSKSVMSSWVLLFALSFDSSIAERTAG